MLEESERHEKRGTVEVTIVGIGSKCNESLR